MNEIVIVCIAFIAAFPLTWGMCELIEYIVKNEVKKFTMYINHEN